MNNGSIDRRDFLKGAAATVALLMATDKLIAAEEGEAPPVTGPPVKFGVIGLGLWGKEIVTTLGTIPSAQVSAICDTYQPYLTKAKEIAPNAATFTDYTQLLASPDVECVVVATPTHQHRDIVLAALEAGKHVYCEAPIAGSIEDARAIGLAAQGSKQVFQAGLQGRSNPLYNHVLKFVRAGALGTPSQVVAQWNKKTSWRRMAPTPQREAELNWRISKATSTGLVGEIGVHHCDLANWFLKGMPTAVSGFGSITAWKDGRDVPDTVQCIIEYPNGVNMVFFATLTSSFSNTYAVFEGSSSSLLLRDTRAWMVKEDDAPVLGWEVYARKEDQMDESCICLVANATKILGSGGEHGKEVEPPPEKEAIFYALENFTRSIRENVKSDCGPVEAYQAAVVAVKANEAINAGSRIALESSLFELK